MTNPAHVADDALPNATTERLAIELYEADPESAWNDGDEVQWRDNYAHRDRYRELARVARQFLDI